MGITASANALPPPQTPAVNADDTITKDFRYLLLALWNRTGQGDGVPTLDQGVSVAAGATYNIAKDWTQFTSVGAGNVVQLPVMAVGTDCIIWNDGGAANLAITPQSGVQIDALGSGNAYTLATAKMQWFRAVTTSLIHSSQWG